MIKKSKYYGCSSNWGVHQTQSIYKVAKVQRYLIENPYKKFNLPSLAKHAGLSSSYLSYFFHKITGKTLKDFSVRIKMCHSLLDLCLTERPIKAISGEVGYKDRFSFTKKFINFFNFSPSKIRKTK